MRIDVQPLGKDIGAELKRNDSRFPPNQTWQEAQNYDRVTGGRLAEWTWANDGLIVSVVGELPKDGRDSPGELSVHFKNWMKENRRKYPDRNLPLTLTNRSSSNIQAEDGRNISLVSTVNIIPDPKNLQSATATRETIRWARDSFSQYVTSQRNLEAKIITDEYEVNNDREIPWEYARWDSGESETGITDWIRLKDEGEVSRMDKTAIHFERMLHDNPNIPKEIKDSLVLDYVTVNGGENPNSENWQNYVCKLVVKPKDMDMSGSDYKNDGLFAWAKRISSDYKKFLEANRSALDGIDVVRISNDELYTKWLKSEEVALGDFVEGWDLFSQEVAKFLEWFDSYGNDEIKWRLKITARNFVRVEGDKEVHDMRVNRLVLTPTDFTGDRQEMQDTGLYDMAVRVAQDYRDYRSITIDQ